MPYIDISVRRSRTFVPAEAQAIAARWRGLAKEIREITRRLQSLGASLSATWEGNSERRFMTEFDSVPGKVAGCAELLESLASRVESITVTEWETVVERVWRPEDVGA